MRSALLNQWQVLIFPGEYRTWRYNGWICHIVTQRCHTVSPCLCVDVWYRSETPEPFLSSVFAPKMEDSNELSLSNGPITPLEPNTPGHSWSERALVFVTPGLFWGFILSWNLPQPILTWIALKRFVDLLVCVATNRKMLLAPMGWCSMQYLERPLG